MSDLTTIQVKKSTRDKLNEIRLGKESHDETINRLLKPDIVEKLKNLERLMKEK